MIDSILIGLAVFAGLVAIIPIVIFVRVVR